MNIQKFAQKGLVVNDKDEVLFIRYSAATHVAGRLIGKYALPGGKIEMGEKVDESIIREVKDETGIICEPHQPFYCWNWEYKKGDDLVQINAVMRFCKYVSGEPRTESYQDTETVIDKVVWIPRNEVASLDIVDNEKPGVDYFLTHIKSLN